MEYWLKSEAFVVKVEATDGQLLVRLRDERSGREWPKVPLLALEIHDKALRREERYERLKVMLAEEADGELHIVVRMPRCDIEAGVWLRLEAGELRVSLPIIEVYEGAPGMFRLFAVDLLPGLMRVSGAGAKLVLPLNTGFVCDLTEAPACQDQFLIYGEQPRWELTPTLPFCAAHNADGGLMALVREGACDARCQFNADGDGGGETGFAMTLRRTWVDPVDHVSREIRIVPLAAADDPVLACARRIRRHVIDDHGKKTLEARATESPEVAYLLEAFIMKLFYGVQNDGYMMQGRENQARFKLCMTFDEANAALRKLSDLGVDKILTQSVGWNARGHDGLYPERFPIEPRVGGEAAFRRLIKHGNALGYHMQIHDNFMMNNLSSPAFDPDLVVQDIYGEPLIQGHWAGGPECGSWGLALPHERLGGHMERMREFGLRGMLYVDYMQKPLEVNYHPRHGGPRSDCSAGQVRIVEEARRVFGACGTEFGFMPCAVAADHIATCGEPWHITHWKPDWPIHSLLAHGDVVPIWQLVFSGLTVCEARGGVSWANVQECVLFGRVPRDEWSTRPGVMPVFDGDRAARLKAVYDLCITRFGHLKRMAISSFIQDGDKRQTTFDDGTTVVADSASDELIVNGDRVACPTILNPQT